MSSKGQLFAKKRPVGSRSDDHLDGSNESSSASSTSFHMEENSLDEEISEQCDDKDKAFQVKPMDSQESDFTAPSLLATQSVARPAKKRKVSVSPQDSLAKKTRPKSPPSIIVIDGGEKAPLLRLDDPRTTKPKSKPAEALTPELSLNPSAASRVKAGSSAAGNEATTVKSVTKISSKKQSYEQENETSILTVVTPKEKVNTKAKKTQSSRQSIAKDKPSNDSKTATTRKTSPAKLAPKSKASFGKGNPKSIASPAKASLVTAIKTADFGAFVKHKAATSARKTADTKDKKAKNKSEPKPQADSRKKKKKSFQDQLLQHVFFSGRPYTVKDLTQHLKTSEASVNFCLLALVDKGWIIKKEFASKSRSRELYWANEDSKNKELLAALDVVAPHEVAEARVKLASLQQQDKATAMELHQVMLEPSNEELNESITNEEKEVARLQAEVDAVLKRISVGEETVVPKQKFGLAKPKVSKARSNPVKIKVEINKMRGEWKKRKEKCIDFIECLADGMDKKVNVVIKMLEIETDENAGVKMPPKYEIKK